MSGKPTMEALAAHLDVITLALLAVVVVVLSSICNIARTAYDIVACPVRWSCCALRWCLFLPARACCGEENNSGNVHSTLLSTASV